MSATVPLHLTPPAGVEIGPVVTLVEGPEGGYVLIRGDVVFSWDVDDEALRRWSATQLVTLKAGTNGAIAAAFGITTVTLWRWREAFTGEGVVGLVPEKRGPNTGSRLFTPEMLTKISELKATGMANTRIGAVTGMSRTSVARALTVIANEQTTITATGTELNTPPPPAAAPGPVPVSAASPSSSSSSPLSSPSVSAVLPVLPAPVDRTGDRLAGRQGLICHAVPVFAPAARVPMAGFFLAFPAIVATGIYDCAHEVFGPLPPGFYGLDTIITEAVIRTLAREPRLEGATRLSPTSFGRILGLDRAPEVKTLRTKHHYLAGQGKGEELITAIAARKLTHADTDLAILYVDGHIRTYHGTKKVAKMHSNRVKFPTPATAETWVSDADGDPVMMVMAEPGTALTGQLRALLPTLRAVIGDDRRVLVGFDRGGWSPTLFKELDEAGFDVLTWRKGTAPDIDAKEFTTVTHTDHETGVAHTWEAADTVVDLETTTKGEFFPMRQISRIVAAKGKKAGTRQIHVLTTRTDLSAGEVLFRMSGRWRQENYFRYARMHFDLDSHPAYATTEDDPDRSVPNPAKETTKTAVTAAKAALVEAEHVAKDLLLTAQTPRPGKGEHSTEVTIDNALFEAITQPVREAEDAWNRAREVNASTPTRVKLGHIAPDQQLANIAMKLLSHAFGMVAFNAETMLARHVRTGTIYSRRQKDAHAFVRAAFNTTGDIDPTTDDVLTIKLDPLPTGRETAALAELCEVLTATETKYPGTNRVLRYEVKNW